MQPQQLSPTQHLDDFCARVKAATGHECRPYRAGVFVIEGKGNDRIVTFQCNDISPEAFPAVLARIIQPSTSALYA